MSDKCAGCGSADSVLVEVKWHTVTYLVCRNNSHSADSRAAQKSCAKKAFDKRFYGACFLCGEGTSRCSMESGIPDITCSQCKKKLTGLSQVEDLFARIRTLETDLRTLLEGQKLVNPEHGLFEKLSRRLGETVRGEAGSILAQVSTGREVRLGGHAFMIDTSRKEATERLVKMWLESLDVAENNGFQRGRSFLLELAQGTFEVDQLVGVKK